MCIQEVMLLFYDEVTDVFENQARAFSHPRYRVRSPYLPVRPSPFALIIVSPNNEEFT